MVGKESQTTSQFWVISVGRQTSHRLGRTSSMAIS